MAKKYLDDIGLETVWNKIKSIFGMPEPLYEEVEWVESTGKQYVYLDWHPPINTWGFEADFIIRNTFNTTEASWNVSTNVNNAGFLFGVRNSGSVNDIEFGTYTSTGYLKIGGSATIASGIKTDKTRQTIKLIGTTLTKPDGTTTTVTRATETANKPYHNMAVFGYYEGMRRSGYNGMRYPSTSRIYSLKFYEGTTVVVNLVGAIRKIDGITGLYDKVSNHFYPAPMMSHGEVVGNLGNCNTILNTAQQGIVTAIANNTASRRLWRVNLSNLKTLEDGQRISISPMYTVASTTETTELAGWDDTSSNSNVYVKATLADGTETDWIPCYYQGTTRLTTHYGSNQTILFTYREDVIIGADNASAGYQMVRGLFADPNYNSDRYYEVYSDTVIAGLNGIKRYSVCMKDANGNWTSIVNEANKAGLSDKTCYIGGLRLSKILYHSASSDYAAGANSSAMWDTYTADLRYSFNGLSSAAASTTIQLRKPFYVVGTIGNDGLFYLDTTKWWTQEEPTEEDGKIYILFGNAYNSYYACYLSAENPVYAYKNGKFQEIFNGHSIEADVPAEAVFTDTTYESKTAAENGTALSLVTTGEKYLWNNAASGTGSASWSNISGKPTETGESTTGISIGNHATGTVIGVQSSTTSVTGVQSTTTTASKVTLGTALSIPNVTDVDSVTVPKAASSATTVPIKNASATSIPNVTNVGGGSASLTFTMDSTDTKKLIINFSHTHTPPTLGTAISITGVQSSTTSVTGVSGSTTASKVTLGTAISVPNVTNVSDVTVPIKATSATTVPIKNTSASTFVTGTTHTITDNGHTHSIS